MTRYKAGQNPSPRDSTNVPIDQATPVIINGPEGDGPEGYSKCRLTKESEEDKTKTPEQGTVTGSFASSKRTIPSSPRLAKKDLALKPSRFGSPFAYWSYQNKPDFFKGLLVESTCVLFDQIVAEASNLKERLSTGVALTNDGSNGHFCVLSKCESLSMGSDCSNESNSNDSKLDLYNFGPSSNSVVLPLSIDPTMAASHRTYAGRNDLVDSNDSGDSSSTTSEISEADKLIDVRRVQNFKTGEIEYFVVNEGLDIFSINGIHVDFLVRAGPLPDFAVFKLEHFSIFWWRTVTALDYMPITKRKRDSEDDEEDTSRKAFKGDTGSSPNSQVFLDSKNWLDEYRRRVKLCEERPIKYTSSITDLHPPHQFSVGELHDIDVILAIGAVWLGLIHAKVDFAYGNSNLFSFARSMRMVGMHAVKGSNHFLMPLIFNQELQALSPESDEDTVEPLEPVFSAFQRGEEEENQENFAAAEKAKEKNPGNKDKPPLSLEDQQVQNQNHKGGIGHFMFAIAEKVNRDGLNTIKDVLTKKALVRLRFMDSAGGIVDKGIIRRVARNIVRNSGWLGDTWPRFDANEEYWEEVLEQSGINRCGEHTVLNAWAYMLEMPLAPTRKGALANSSYEEIRRLMRLALLGQLDSLTIRAWMQHYQYAVHEPLSQLQQTQIQNPGLPNKLRNMQTVALNENAFNELVNDMHTQEQASNQGHATIWGAVPVPPNSTTTQKSENARKVATRVTLPSAGQGQVAGPSGSSTGTARTPLLPQTSIPTPRNWKEKLVRSVAHHRALREKNPRTTRDTLKDASTILDSSRMADFDVVLGIAPIWEGLKRLGRADFDFTYAGMDMFSPGGGQRGVGAVGRWSRFIMPLFISSTKAEALEDQGNGQGKNDLVGHLLLCVAELVDHQPMTVQIEILDSRMGTVNPRQIEARAQTIINDSGWLGANGSETRIVYRPYISRQVPRQVGVNTCGLHVIFNAWATMLGIPIYPSLLRRGRRREDVNDATDQGFLRRGLEIVNLALGGFMDSATIQAFFNHYGYSVEQRFRDPARAVIPVKAVGMNQDKFRRTLEKRHWSSIIASARARNVRHSDADMADLVGQGLTADQAWTALSITGGNPKWAFQWHYGPDVPGELPKPEEALSPRTPEEPGQADY